MACALTRSRAEACKDVVAGIKEVYFADFGSLGTVTLTNDEITNMTGDSSNDITLHKYLVKGNNSFETTINASRENGTVFYEQTLNITLKKLTKEDHKELKLLAAARPHVIVPVSPAIASTGKLAVSGPAESTKFGGEVS